MSETTKTTKMDQAWTAYGEIYIPDVRIETADPSHTYLPLRGFGSVMAVFGPSPDGKCLGFIEAKTLGFETVKAWMLARPGAKCPRCSGPLAAGGECRARCDYADRR